MSNSVYFYKSEVLCSGGLSLEGSVDSFLNNVSNISRHELQAGHAFNLAYLDWSNLYPQVSPEESNNLTILSYLIYKILNNSKIAEFDQVICNISPSLQWLDEHLKKSGSLKSWPSVSCYEDFITKKLAEFGITMPTQNIQLLDNTCTSGNSLIGYAQQGIRCGLWKSVLLISIDLIDPYGIHILNTLGALTTESKMSPQEVSRPFDSRRSGFVKGDGAAIAIITSTPEIKNESLAEVLGFAQTSDAFKLTDGRDDAASIITAMRFSIERSGLSLEQIDLIKSHGTSTTLNDKHEAFAIKSVFGGLEKIPPITSLKGHIGHVTDCSGLLENAVVCAAIKRGYYIPILNLKEPAFELPFVTEKIPVPDKEIVTVLCNNLGFGGNNSCLVLGSTPS